MKIGKISALALVSALFVLPTHASAGWGKHKHYKAEKSYTDYKADKWQRWHDAYAAHKARKARMWNDWVASWKTHKAHKWDKHRTYKSHKWHKSRKYYK